MRSKITRKLKFAQNSLILCLIKGFLLSPSRSFISMWMNEFNSIIMSIPQSGPSFFSKTQRDPLKQISHKFYYWKDHAIMCERDEERLEQTKQRNWNKSIKCRTTEKNEMKAENIARIRYVDCVVSVRLYAVACDFQKMLSKSHCQPSSWTFFLPLLNGRIHIRKYYSLCSIAGKGGKRNRESW